MYLVTPLLRTLERRPVQTPVDRNVCHVPSLTVQAIYVLRNLPLISQPMMNCVGLYMAVRCKPLEVPQQKFVWMRKIHLPRGHLLRSVILTANSPKAIRTPKSRNATFRAYACASYVEGVVFNHY